MTTPSLAPSAESTRLRLAGGLALPSRVRYTALLLAAVAMAGITGTLAATEVGLPFRTRSTLVLLSVIGAAWAVLAVWVLARREVLYARHRVVAGWMAVVFSALLTAGCVALGWLDRENSMWLTATGVGGTMLLLAVLLLQRARKALRALVQRRDALEATLRATAAER
jgi:hypothetical protein